MSLSLEKLSALLRGITPQHNGDFYCLNSLHSFRTKSKPELRQKVCENKDCCVVAMPSEDTKVNQYQKSNKETICYLCRS